MARVVCLCLLAFGGSFAEAALSRSGTELSASMGAGALAEMEGMALQGKNPIRKIVTLMQDMQKELEAEGAKEKELFDKFMCFCNGNGGEMQTAIETAKASIEQLGAKLKSEEAEKAQLTQELVEHKSDREGAKSDLAEATSLREKEKAEYDSLSADSKTNIEALGNAVKTLEAATAGASFVQLPKVNVIRKIVEQAPNVDDWDRKGVIAFIEQKDSAPASGQIIGVMKQMKDEMVSTAKQADEDEAKASAGYADLKASKNQEIAAATEAIEKKTVRSGELAVSVVQTKDDLEDTTEELAQTEKYADQLASQCATKEKEWAERQKMRAEEISAISEAIGILNDDDALDTFKKALPSALVQQSVGFLQQTNRHASRVHRAQALFAKLAVRFPSPKMKVLLFTMNSKIKLQSKGHFQKFSEIIKMVDDMVVVLGKEQDNDLKQKNWCAGEFEKAADEEAGIKSKQSSLDSAIEETTDEIQSLEDEIMTLGSEIKNLDKAVAEATVQRKEEHSEYLQTMTLNDAAIGLIGKAKARLEKFYKPALVQQPDDSDDSSALSAFSFAQVSSHSRAKSDSEMDTDVAPPPAPETFIEYKKNKKSGGVMGLMDQMIHEMELGSKDSEYEEKTAQKDYQELMNDSQQSRARNTKSLTDKGAAKAQLETQLQTAKEDRQFAETEFAENQQLQANLHSSCDFIMKNFDLRKEARGNEIESLKNAKAILAGADFR